MTKFIREFRYYILKLSDFQHLTEADKLTLDHIGAKTYLSRKKRGKPDLSCVVVESDWPEYELIWSMIESRETAQTEKEKLKKTFNILRNETEKAAHAYAAACELGDERTLAFEVYERIHNATLVG